MSLLVKEYNIPFLGKVELLDSNGGYVEHFNGKYYAKNDKLGEFCTKCESVEELMEKVSLEIKNNIKYQIELSENKIAKEQENKRNLETILEKTNIKEDVSQANYDWLKQYQTDNTLQLEFQHKKIEFMGDDQ